MLAVSLHLFGVDLLILAPINYSELSLHAYIPYVYKKIHNKLLLFLCYNVALIDFNKELHDDFF